MKITEKEYLESLATVRRYLVQRSTEISSGTSVYDWMKKIRLIYGGKYNHGEVRLFNCLRACKSGSVESITKEQFMKLRNAGPKSWKTFVSLRGY